MGPSRSDHFAARLRQRRSPW